MDPSSGRNVRRRIVVATDEEEEQEEQLRSGQNDEDEVGSNPDDEINENIDEDDDAEGEDLAENWIEDYAPAPELDFYDTSILADERDERPVSYEQMVRDRRAADEELDAADARRREQEEEAEDNLDEMNERDRDELEEYEDDDDDEGEDEFGVAAEERALNLEAFECPLAEWIAEERTRREIQRRFKTFILTFFPGIDEFSRWKSRYERDETIAIPPSIRQLPSVYPPKIRAMCAANRSSLEVSYVHLGEMQSLLAIWLTDLPRDMLQIFDEVLHQVVLAEFPHYAHITQEVHVRIIGLPLSDRLRDLRQGDLNSLVRVSGVITRRSGVFPQLKSVAYDCKACGQVLGPFRITGAEVRPTSCISCQETGPFAINNQKSEYGNYQKITLQESPGSVPAGRVPRQKEVILLGDLIDIARPGEEIEVTGIYEHNQIGVSTDQSGFPVFSTTIMANNVQKKSGSSNTDLSDEDKRQIRELSNDPQIGERIIRSIAPSIYGHRHVKTAMALSLFGGCAKEGGAGGTHRVRGDINVLLLGDPGTAKSQFLKYAEKAAPRAVYTTGKGASAVGLTAGVHRDPTTKEWTLEGGALVLADQGVCLIDEFDKMNEQDRTSIHEAMEQQTISVSKAGIVTSLQARCGVLAAANPIGGRYDPSYTLAENVELTDPILQRFDILCVLQDIVDPIVDEQLALFVINSHMRSHPDAQAEDHAAGGGGGGAGVGDDGQRGEDGLERDLGAEDDDEEGELGNGGRFRPAKMANDGGPQPLDQVILKKYLTYARAFVKPVLHEVDSEKIASLYAELRKQSSITGGVPIAVRHIESVMRMAEASARMHLRDHVRDDDVDLAIKVMLESFLQAQKVAVRKTLQRSFRKYITYGEESNQLIMHQLQNLLRVAEQYKKLRKDRNSSADFTEIFINDLENRAKDLNIYDLRPFYNSAIFRNHGLTVDERRQVIIKHY